MISTEDLALFDACPRLQLFSLYEPPRVTLATVLTEALRIGLLSGKADKAKNHVMLRAADPGLAISAHDIYNIAVHHASLIEVIVQYLLADEGAWIAARAIKVEER